VNHHVSPDRPIVTRSFDFAAARDYLLLIAVSPYRERTPANAFVPGAIALAAWITAALRASSISAKLNDQRLELERWLNELQ